MKRKRSFSGRLSRNILFMVSILFIIALSIAAVSSHMLIAEEATRTAEYILKSSVAEIENELIKVEAAAAVESLIARDNMDKDDYIYYVTQQIVSQVPHIVGSAVAYREGLHRGDKWFSPYSYKDLLTDSVMSKQLGNENYDYFTMDWYTCPVRDMRACWTEPYFDEGGANRLMTTYSIPLVSQKGKVDAVVTADLDLEWLAEKVDSIRPYANSGMILVSRNGRYISNSVDTAMAGTSFYETVGHSDNDELKEIAREMKNGGSGVLRFSIGNAVSFAVFGPLNNGWSAAIICQYRDVLERSSQMHMVIILIGLVGLLILFIACYITIKRLTRPITELSVSALNMAKGNFKAQLPNITSNDEMLQLRNSFAFMQTSLDNYITELKTTTEANTRMEGELNVARDIQMSMLSKNFPNNLFAMVEPAKEVGGDLYDFSVHDNRICFSVGDVSGKGVPAAMVMAITRSASSFFAGMDLPLNQVASHINAAIANNNEMGMFVTFFTARFDLATRKLTFCNAGHNPIIVCPPDADPYFLKAKSNLALGLFADFAYEEESIDLQPGTRLVLYTDGVSEAEKCDKELFGDDRLLAWAKESCLQQPTDEDVVKHLYSTVKSFVDGNDANDDITIMSITL